MTLRSLRPYRQTIAGRRLAPPELVKPFIFDACGVSQFVDYGHDNFIDEILIGVNRSTKGVPENGDHRWTVRIEAFSDGDPFKETEQIRLFSRVVVNDDCDVVESWREFVRDQVDRIFHNAFESV